jgi:hypothetical protein
MDINSFQSGQVGAVNTPPSDTHRTLSRDEPPMAPRCRRTPLIERSDLVEPLGWLHLIGPGTFLVAAHLRSSLLGHALESSDRADPRL